jgi:hypothetical protein
MGVRILEDPHGFLDVDNRSMVVSIAASVPVKQIVLDICRPAGIIWIHNNSFASFMQVPLDTSR